MGDVINIRTKAKWAETEWIYDKPHTPNYLASLIVQCLGKPFADEWLEREWQRHTKGELR